MPIRSLRHVFVPLAVVALAAGLTACRGEDKAPAATDSGPIKIMQIGTFESPNLSLTDAKAGLDAHVQSINAAGGINGRKIEVQFCNDAFNANTGAACARTAVSDGVVAVVGAASSQAPAALPVLEAAGIPWLAGAGSGGPIEGTSSVSYPITGGTQSMQVGMGRLLANKGGKNIAVIVADAAAAYAAADDIANGAKAGGAQSYRVLAPLGAPDFSAVASSALAKTPDAIAVASTATDAPRIIKAVRQAGFKGNISTLANIFKPADQKALGDLADNVFVASSAVPVSNTSVPQVQQFLADMAKYHPEAVTDNGSLGTWNAVTFFVEIVKRLDGQVSAAAITGLLSKLDKPIVLGTVPDYAGIPNPPVVSNYPRVPTFKVYVSQATGGTLKQDGDPIEPLATK
ncbi:ABC transporter substrate-binding protein [Dactylosporangium sp. NBC_01737]|uniref:ABC transporter substrate-binding protein n=1 Tax=Dactylosporangium sp. NBC_01737 TaxID=2975959 RepID=UPI002E156F44|nr:ABC transporter substrate-binding protein [Dactylosporangium sp. NBC_01737]